MMLSGFFSLRHLKPHYLYLLIFRNANQFIRKLKNGQNKMKLIK